MNTLRNIATIHSIAETTGLPFAECQCIVKAFEATHGGLVLEKLLGRKTDLATATATVAFTTGRPATQCTAVLTALDQIIESGLWNKRHPFKRAT